MAKLKWINHEDLAIKRTPSVLRDEYLDHMTFKRNVRPMFTEIFGPIIGLKEEWEEQGATPAELDFSAFDYRCQFQLEVPVNTMWMGSTECVTISEDSEHRIYRDGMGRTMKLPLGFATIALPLDFPVKNMDDWLEIKHNFEFSEDRFAPGWEDTLRKHRAEGYVISATMPGAYSMPRELMGDEMVCVGYYEQPELIRDMLDTFGETCNRVFERVCDVVPIDRLFVHEDMAGKSGPLAGPRQIEEFFKPYYQRVWKPVQAKGAVLFDMDSDGNMNAVIDALLETGLNAMHPMEPEAGMDIVKLREKYGTRLAVHGGIDKYVLQRTKADIEAELEYKVPPMVASGGCVFALDHRVLNGVPIENYRFYVAKMWEIMNREAAKLG